jgi:hypothetical protein
VCQKKLIERLPNGLWRFAFGRQKKEVDELGEPIPFDKELYEPAVVLLIRGSLKMKCLRKTCSHEQILPFFPQSSDFHEEASNQQV